MILQTLHRENFLLHLQEREGYDQPVLIKEAAHEPPTQQLSKQLHNEYAITRQLADITGVRRVYAKEGSQSRPVLLLEYVQGQSISDSMQSSALDLQQKLRIAIEVAATLGRIHRQGITHKEINSHNILVADDGSVWIIDFAMATSMRQEIRPLVSNGDFFDEATAYISPEQTGRMNRSVDYRSDLYSFGVTLYELFTGQLPFQTGDTIEMIHAHMASRPVPPRQRCAELPEPLSDIILKLLAKNAEDRYQSANGLRSDLRKCQKQLKTGDEIEPFELGKEDFSGRLQISQKLYGRQDEIEKILATYDRVVQGSVELLLVAGYSGVGKTSLVHEIYRPIIAKRGAFIEGKFDQYQRNIPYYAWGQAFARLVAGWLAESDSELSRLKTTILNAVGDNGQVLADIIPNLTRIIGPQPDPYPLGGLEAQNRFNYLFQRFINAIVSPDRPLVVFLDDMQWIDLASLSLLKKLLTSMDGGHFLLIGAYRDNEVDSTHPLVLGLSDIKEARATINHVALGNLAQEDITHLIFDSLQRPCSFCLPLSQLIHAKTSGNAFFTHQLLYALEEEGLLWFDTNGRSWQCDQAKLKKLAISDNVVDLLVSKVDRLPEATQGILRIASCLGNQFDFTFLSQVAEQSPDELPELLHSAYQDGILVRLNGFSRFAHDRIQQAAYSLIPDSEKVVLHRQIGQTLLRETPQPQDKRLFDIVGHLNLAIPVIESEAERVELAELNTKAARDGMRAAAFAAAEAYAHEAIDLLGSNGWQDHYALMLKLHQLAAEVAYLTQEFERSWLYVDTMLAEAHSLLNQMPAIITKIRLYHARNEMDEVMDTGRAAINELGFTYRGAPPSGLSVRAISELPVMYDPAAVAAMEVLENLLITAYVAHFERFPSVIYTALHLMLKFGVHPASSGVVAYFAMLIWSEDIEAAYRFGDLSRQLVDKFDANRYLCPVNNIFFGYILPWNTHYGNLTGELLNTVQLAFEFGDRVFGAGCLTISSYMITLSGRRLDQVQETMAKNIKLQQKIGESYTAYNIPIWTQFVANLRGLAVDPLQLEGRFFSQARDLPNAHAAGLFAPPAFTHCLKLALHYHLGEYSSAYTNSIEVEQYVLHLTAHIVLALFTFYQSLTILQLPSGQDQHPDLEEKLAGNIAKLRHWAEYGPMNHLHNLDLLLAEKARVAGNVGDAIDYYELAITGARENEYIREEALANELYGRFWQQRGNDVIAPVYLREAHALYGQWGAVAIVEHLEASYPQWLKVEAIDTGPRSSSISTGQAYRDLDINSILKASQAIAGEIELNKLLGKMIEIVMENAGAQRGFLIIERDGQWVIAAQSEGDQSVSQANQGAAVSDNVHLAERIVNFVAHTQKALILDDASNEGDFSFDPYIQKGKVRSVLCIPLANRAKTTGVLYLENNLTNGAFTLQHQEVLELLSSQMAISIEHAELYKRLEDTVTERTLALSDAEAQIRTLFESSPLGIALNSFEGKFLAVNRAMLRMLRLSEEELLQRKVADFYVDPRQRDTLLERLRESGAVQDFGVQVLRHDGSSFFASLNSSRLVLEGSDVILALIEDVTDQITAEQESAVLEERERLARELHDAVTQTLFSASLLAQAAPRMLDKNPAVARQNIEQLALLIRGALAEMRALLLELRPSEFRGRNIAELFGMLAESTRARTRANVTLNIDVSCSFQEDVAIALYRIAQETLNNIAKHALAGEVVVDLTCDPEGARLSVKDDGRGFDLQAIPVGHLGVSIMRERAQKIGAKIKIDSNIGGGTQVNVSWSASGNENEHE